MVTAIFALRYITTWITMAVSIIVLLTVSEAAYGFLLERFAWRGISEIVNPVRSIAASATSSVVLPDCVSARAAIIMPALAIAALFPVCSSMSFFTFSTLINNGGDVLQIIYFIILSQTLALAAIYSLGTEYASRSAAWLASDFIKLLTVLMAAFVSFANYFAALGVQGNPFGLGLYLLSLHLKLLNLPGYIAVAIFVFLALCYSSHGEERESGDVFNGIPLREFDGLPRAMLQIWATFKAFLTATLITHFFFPWFIFKEADNSNDSFLLLVLAFALFWLTVILVRTFGVMLCRNARAYVEKRIPAVAVSLLAMLLTAAAVGIIYYEAYLTALEAY